MCVVVLMCGCLLFVVCASVCCLFGAWVVLFVVWCLVVVGVGFGVL